MLSIWKSDSRNKLAMPSVIKRCSLERLDGSGQTGTREENGEAPGLHAPSGNVWPLGPGACKEQLLLMNWAFGTCWTC